MAAAGGATLAAGTAAVAAEPKKSIVLYCDLAVDPKREKEMLDHFHKVFAPVAAKHKGYIDLKMLKLTKHIQGPTLPKAINYRFQLTYENGRAAHGLGQLCGSRQGLAGHRQYAADQDFQVDVFDNV